MSMSCSLAYGHLAKRLLELLRTPCPKQRAPPMLVLVLAARPPPIGHGDGGHLIRHSTGGQMNRIPLPRNRPFPVVLQARTTTMVQPCDCCRPGPSHALDVVQQPHRARRLAR